MVSPTSFSVVCPQEPLLCILLAKCLKNHVLHDNILVTIFPGRRFIVGIAVCALHVQVQSSIYDAQHPAAPPL